jgi:signal peptidase II
MTRIITLTVIATLVGIDQFFKSIIIKSVMPVGEVTVIKGVLRFIYVENTGAVFGSLPNSTTILTVLTTVIIAVSIILLMTKKIHNKFMFSCLVIIVSGGIGNLIDRIAKGYVVDYIEPLFVNFAIFNFADCLVVVGAFSMMGYLIVDLIRDLRKAKHEEF